MSAEPLRMIQKAPGALRSFFGTGASCRHTLHKNTLEKSKGKYHSGLVLGRARPRAASAAANAESAVLEREIRALGQRFAATLCDEQAALYTVLLCERRAEAAARHEAAIFAQGVRLGAKLIAETAQPRENCDCQVFHLHFSHFI